MPRRKLRYIDAVRILGGGDNKVVKAAEALLGAAILSTATVVPGALGLLGVRNEMVKLAEKLLGGLGRRVRGVHGHSHTELLLAAHTVIVLTAYIDALADVRRRRQARCATGGAPARASDQGKRHPRSDGQRIRSDSSAAPSVHLGARRLDDPLQAAPADRCAQRRRNIK